MNKRKSGIQESFDGVCYVRGLTVPRTIPAGRVLVHNHVQHGVDTPNGWNGFRAWTQKLSDGLESCKCGWSGLPHYRVKQNKLREFPEWPVEQVMEVARMLYVLRPFKIDSKSELQWNSLAREAFDFLDKLHNACKEIGGRRSLQDAAYRKAETRSAEAEKLPVIVPFDRALRVITNQHTTKRAERNFKTLVLALPNYFGGRFGQAPTSRTLDAQIARWRKTGIPRGEVMELQAVFDNSWLRIKAEKNRRKAKKRKQWEGGRVGKKLSDTFGKIA